MNKDIFLKKDISNFNIEFKYEPAWILKVLLLVVCAALRQYYDVSIKTLLIINWFFTLPYDTVVPYNRILGIGIITCLVFLDLNNYSLVWLWIFVHAYWNSTFGSNASGKVMSRIHHIVPIIFLATVGPVWKDDLLSTWGLFRCLTITQTLLIHMLIPRSINPYIKK